MLFLLLVGLRLFLRSAFVPVNLRLVFPHQLQDLPLTFSDASFGDDYLLPPFDPAVFLQKW